MAAYLAKDLEREAHVGEKRIAVACPQARRPQQGLFVIIQLGAGTVLEVAEKTGYQRY